MYTKHLQSKQAHVYKAHNLSTGEPDRELSIWHTYSTHTFNAIRIVHTKTLVFQALTIELGTYSFGPHNLDTYNIRMFISVGKYHLGTCDLERHISIWLISAKYL